jgi:hypothetical protein
VLATIEGGRASGWRLEKTTYEEAYNLFASRNTKMKWTVHLASMRLMRNAPKISVGKPEGERQIGRH